MSGCGQPAPSVRHYHRSRACLGTPAARYDGTNGEEIASWARYQSIPRLGEHHPGPIEVMESGRLRIDTQHGPAYAARGAYVVMDVKGYFYPCEADVFHEVYCEHDLGRDVGWAHQMLLEGRKVCRAGWNGRNMWIWLHPGIEGAGKGERSKPFLVMHTARGEEQPGWLCSQEDFLATDWTVYRTEEV